MISKMKALMNNTYTDKIEIVAKIHDPVFDEGKKEEKPQKAAKKGDKLPEPEEPKIEVVDYSYLQQGSRSVCEIPLHYNLHQLYETASKVIPAPIYPDPNTLPIQEPTYL